MLSESGGQIYWPQKYEMRDMDILLTTVCMKLARLVGSFEYFSQLLLRKEWWIYNQETMFRSGDTKRVDHLFYGILGPAQVQCL